MIEKSICGANVDELLVQSMHDWQDIPFNFCNSVIVQLWLGSVGSVRCEHSGHNNGDSGLWTQDRTRFFCKTIVKKP